MCGGLTECEGARTWVVGDNCKGQAASDLIVVANRYSNHVNPARMEAASQQRVGKKNPVRWLHNQLRYSAQQKVSACLAGIAVGKISH